MLKKFCDRCGEEIKDPSKSGSIRMCYEGSEDPPRYPSRDFEVCVKCYATIWQTITRNDQRRS